MIEVVIDWHDANNDNKVELVNFWVNTILVDYPVFDRYYTISETVKQWFHENDISMVCAYLIGYFHPEEGRYYANEAYYYGGWKLIKGILFTFDKLEDAILFKLKWG
jgi:hypothetical protein